MNIFVSLNYFLLHKSYIPANYSMKTINSPLNCKTQKKHKLEAGNVEINT